MVTVDNTTEVTPFIRPRIAESANVLLIASDNAPTAKQACQNLLTTVSERTERAIAIEYAPQEETWVDRLTHEPANLHRVPIYEGNTLPAQTRTFLKGLGEEEFGIVYVDSLSAVASDFGVEDTVNWLADTVQTLSTTNSNGFFRVDPNVVDPTSFNGLVEHTATYVPTEQGWQISPSE